MDSGQPKKLTTEHREKLENLVWGFFGKNEHPFFDLSGSPAGLVDDFVSSDEVISAAVVFAKSLDALWRKRYPMAKPLRLLKESKELIPKVETMVFPILAPEPLGDTVPSQAHKSQQSKVTTHATTVDSKPAKKEDVMDTESLNATPPSPGVPVTSEPIAGADGSLAGLPAPQTLNPGQIPRVPVAPAKVPDQQINFHLPNCKVGVGYSAKIEGVGVAGASVLIADIKFPDGLGLSFDPETQMVAGEPKLDGEFELPLQWRFSDSTAKAGGKCRLTSNPDPKSLWKVLEPETGLPYPKPHLDQKLLIGNGFKIVAGSRRGRSHEHGGTFRDDDFFISDDASSGWSVIIVADGAGSAKSSREGSRIAVSTAGPHMVSSFAGDFGSKINALLGSWDTDSTSQQAIGNEFHYFFHKTASLAVQAIEQEAESTGAAVKEFSTTLLAAAVRRDGNSTFLATFWMGDGAIAAYGPRGTVKLMGSPDGGEFAGQTRFLDKAALSDQGFGKRVRIGRLENVSSVILMTDGVSDPYFETDNGLADPTKWDALWDEITPLLAGSAPELKLVDWLHFFKQGHHDDRTIALLW